MAKTSSKLDGFWRKSRAELRLMLVWVSVKTFCQCLIQYVWFLLQHNPLAILVQRQRRLGFVENYGEVLIKPKVKERVLDMFLTDYRRRRRLLAWVHSRLLHVPVIDFSSSWQDGIALCALLESVCPGVCPSYHLLQQHNRVKNCRLGLKLASKYLYLPMDLLSPEEMAIAEVSTEPKIIQYVSMLKWASQNIKDKWTSLHESLIAAKTGKCFAKGAGLRNGIVGRRSKFTIIISDTIGVFNLLLEIRGPNNEYCGERIVALHQAKGMFDKAFDSVETNNQFSDGIKYLEDGSGSTFVRKKVPPRYAAESTETIHLDFQCGEEGSFYVTFVPKRAGMHNLAIKWQNHHVEGSPFRIKVYKASNVSSKNIKGAQEKRVIYDSLSFSVDSSQEESLVGQTDSLVDDTTPSNMEILPSGRTAAAIAKSKAYSKGRQLTVTRRRVLRRIITRNGEDIVIEEAVSPTLSRQSSSTDTSDDDSRKHSQTHGTTKEEFKAENSYPSQKPDLPNIHSLASTRLGTVIEEEKEKSSGDSSSVESHGLDTEAVKEALNKFKSSGSEDNPPSKYRQYSDDIMDNDTAESEKRPEECKTSDKEMANIVIPESNKERNKRENSDQSNDDNGKIDTIVDGDQGQSYKDPMKTTALRTRSDGPVYVPMRQRNHTLSSSSAPWFSSFEEGSTSEMSSDDVYTSPDDENGSGPALKLLHSSSFKKACMYVSQNTVPNYEAELPPLPRIKSCSKTKLTATRSLPIMRKLHQRDQDQMEKCSVNDLLKSLRQLERETSVDVNDRKSKNEDFPSIARKQSIESNQLKNAIKQSFNELKEMQLSKPTTQNHEVTDTKIFDRGSPTNTDKLTHADNTVLHQALNEKNTKIKDDNKTTLFREKFNIEDSSLNKQKEHKVIPKWPTREILKRQDPIKNSSEESSQDSDKNIKAKTSELQDAKQRVNTIGTEEGNVFRSLSIQRSLCKDTLYTSVVRIVIPKPKVDKSTQVTDVEITSETGWNIIEGMYMLLRRISIKVPNQETGENSCNEKIEHQQELRAVTQNTSSSKVVDIIVNSKDVSSNQKHGNESKKLSKFIVENDRLNNEANNRNMNHVDDWLERNKEIMNKHVLLQPARQMTIETVDSGYDDNPANFNRNPRWSLPLIRSMNGHLRLCRKPYRGQMFLPAKLVLSNSSQSQAETASIGKHEKGDEADDEFDDTMDEFNFDAEKLNLIRKRRHFTRRVDSFSLSDSELETKTSSYKRTRRGWKDVLIINRLVPKKERTKAIKEWASERPVVLPKRKASMTKKVASMKDGKQFSIESTDDDTTVFTDSTEAAYLKPKPLRMNLKHPHPPSSWKDLSSGSERQMNSISSIDDNYTGFGISKADRSSFLSHIDEFQHLCTDEQDAAKHESTANELEDSKIEVESICMKSVSSRSTESDGIEENEILRSYIREKRHSWDGILDYDLGGYDLDFDHTNELERETLSEDGKTQDYGCNENGTNEYDVDSESIVNCGESDIGDNYEILSSCDILEPLDQTNDYRDETYKGTDINLEPTEAVPLPIISDQEITELKVIDVEDIENKVRVAGPGLSSGQVGIKNSFQVWSCDPGADSLNVSITGPRPHTVTETSVLYTGDNLYEITYEVTQPGFYKIFVKWADVNLPSSPYIAEITF